MSNSRLTIEALVRRLKARSVYAGMPQATESDTQELLRTLRQNVGMLTRQLGGDPMNSALTVGEFIEFLYKYDELIEFPETVIPPIPGVLDDLSDVVAPAPNTGDLLQFNGTNWVPAAPAVQTGVIKAVVFPVDAGGSTSSTTPANLTASTKNFTPIRNDSNVVVTVTAEVIVNNTTSQNNYANIGVSLSGASPGGIVTFGAFSGSGGNGWRGTGVFRIYLAPAGAPVALTLRGYRSAGTAYTISCINQWWVIEEFAP